MAIRRREMLNAICRETIEHQGSMKTIEEIVREGHTYNALGEVAQQAIADIFHGHLFRDGKPYSRQWDSKRGHAAMQMAMREKLVRLLPREKVGEVDILHNAYNDAISQGRLVHKWQ